MKSITKAVIAAGALALGTQAQAAIDGDVGIGPIFGNGTGELFLSVVDRGGPLQRSYVLDLGINTVDFLANDASYLNSVSIAADANLQDILDNRTGTIYWNVFGVQNQSDENFNGAGYLSTAPTATLNLPAGYAGLQSAIQNSWIYINSVNGLDTDYAADVSKIFSQADNAFYDTSWAGVNGLFTHDMEGALDQALGFYFIALTDINNDSTTMQTLLGQWTLSSEGTLTYAGVGAPVPVPAAVWLLGSALIGLVGVARRKSEIEGGLVA